MLQRCIETEVGGEPAVPVAAWSQVASFEHPFEHVKSPEDKMRENIEASKAKEVERLTYRYDDRDIILYNLSVGAKRYDLDLVFEDSPAFQPVPVYRLIPALEPFLIYNNRNLVPNFSDRRALHGEHYLEILKHPISRTGTLKTYARILDVIDKGSAAIVITGLHTRDAATNEDVFYNEATFFLRGSGGFGGPRIRQSPLRHHAAARASPAWRAADVSIEHKTSEEQAALYRLTGDRVGMHIDPTFSADAGFPIRFSTARALWASQGTISSEITEGTRPSATGSPGVVIPDSNAAH